MVVVVAVGLRDNTERDSNRVLVEENALCATKQV